MLGMSGVDHMAKVIFQALLAWAGDRIQGRNFADKELNARQLGKREKLGRDVDLLLSGLLKVEVTVGS